MAGPHQHPAPGRPAARCPRCGGPTDPRATPPELCPPCRSTLAWDRYGAPGARLVILEEDIERALALRRPQGGDEPWPRRVARLALVAAAAALAAAAVAACVRLWGFQELAPLAELRQRLLAALGVALATGAAAVAAGLGAAALVRRTPRLRSWRQALATTGAAAVGAAALGTAALWWLLGGSGTGWTYWAMPALARDLALAPVAGPIVQATVVILAPDADGDAGPLAIGAGTIVHTRSDRAWIVTCSHVAMPYAAVASWRDAAAAQPVWVYFSDGRHGRGRVEWTAQPPLDVAVVSAAIADPPPPVPVLPRAEVAADDEVHFVPNPLRSGWAVHSGRILRVEPHATPAGEYSLLVTDLPVQPGDSGSGLFDRDGRLVGMSTWASRDADGRPVGISLPARAVREVLARTPTGQGDRE
jgi:S1-C subfamily serine protease